MVVVLAGTRQRACPTPVACCVDAPPTTRCARPSDEVVGIASAMILAEQFGKKIQKNGGAPQLRKTRATIDR